MEKPMPRTASTDPYRFVSSDAATAKSSDMAGLHSSRRPDAPWAVRGREEWLLYSDNAPNVDSSDERRPSMIRHLFRFNKQPKLPPPCPRRMCVPRCEAGDVHGL